MLSQLVTLQLKVSGRDSFNFIQINILFHPKKSSAKFFIYLLTWRTSLDHTVFWCLVMVERLFLGMPRGCLQFVIVVFPNHTHLLFSMAEVHLLNPPYCLRTSDLDVTQHCQTHTSQWRWHDGTLLRPTIFHLVCLNPDQSCTRISQQGNGTLVYHLDPPYSVWLVWVC